MTRLQKQLDAIHEGWMLATMWRLWASGQCSFTLEGEDITPVFQLPHVTW